MHGLEPIANILLVVSENIHDKFHRLVALLLREQGGCLLGSTEDLFDIFRAVADQVGVGSKQECWPRWSDLANTLHFSRIVVWFSRERLPHEIIASASVHGVAHRLKVVECRKRKRLLFVLSKPTLLVRKHIRHNVRPRTESRNRHIGLVQRIDGTMLGVGARGDCPALTTLIS